MSVFSRFKDIVESNINSMLDRTENPEKMLRLMIQEMEDTLVELKVSCTQAMAERLRMAGSLEEADKEARRWQERAELAISKGREDLAREALVRKRLAYEGQRGLDADIREADMLVERFKSEIQLVEDKLVQARERLRLLLYRRAAVAGSKTTGRPEPPAPAKPSEDLARQIDSLKVDEQIDKELSEIKAKLNNSETPVKQ
jgi:phage shock protein A